MRKRILAIIMVLAMVCTTFAFAVPSSASAVGLKKATYAVPSGVQAETDENGVSSVPVGANGTLSWAGLSRYAFYGTGTLNLQPDNRTAELKKGEAYAELKFEVTKAGEYELVIEYTTNDVADASKQLACVLIVNGEEQPLALQNARTAPTTSSVKVQLNEGENTVRLTNPDYSQSPINVYITLRSIVVKGSGVVADKIENDVPFIEPLAAYDFEQGLEDLTGKHDAIVLDEEHALNAELKDGGIDFTEGYFRLPDDLFTDVPEDEIEGFTYSMTLTTHQAADEGGKWSRVLFAFSSDNIPEPVGEDSGDDPNRAAASFYASWSGNVGTARRPYRDQGNWLDGCMWWVLHWEQRHVYTLTYDIKTNTVKIYVDGNLQADSSAPKNWETLASLTAADIKSFKVNSVGKSFGGNWAEKLASMLVEDVTVYSKPLTEDQVKLLNEGGYENLLDGDHVLKATYNDDGTHTIACTNEGCSYSVTEKCTPDGNKDCEKDTLCTVCGGVLKEAGAHELENYEDLGNGLHKGTCKNCGAEVTAPHTADKRTDCTEDVVCKDCGAVITEGCADHAWSEWEDDGEGHHVRTCQNEWCEGSQTEAHTYTDEMNVCPKCGAANPNFKAPETDPAESDPAESDPAESDPAESDPTESDPAESDPTESDPAESDPTESDPAESDPAESDPATTDPAETDEGGKGPSDQPPKTGDSGIALFVTLAVVSAASIAVVAGVPGKKRH